MNTNKKYAAIGAAVVGVAVIGWFALSHVATSRAEESIHAFLAKHDLRQTVSWKNLSASPFGTVTIKDIAIRQSRDGMLHVRHVQLSDFVDNADQKRVHLKVEGLADEQGHSPLGTSGALNRGGITQLPPLSFEVKWDMRLKDDEAAMELSFDQPDALQGELALDIQRIAGLARFAEGKQQSAQANPFAPSLMGGFGVLQAIGAVELRSVSANVKDQGQMARTIALHKRYSFNVPPEETNAAKFRNAAFKAEMDQSRSGCIELTKKSYPGLTKGEDSCEALADFLSGKSSRLSVKAQPAQPVSVAQLMEAAWPRPENAILLLNPVFD